eukprot:Hpha_TRINITY_DN16106_c1_g9::TRINITY_DN16106_c1_g9_i1::g.4101::m.4101
MARIVQARRGAPPAAMLDEQDSSGESDAEEEDLASLVECVEVMKSDEEFYADRKARQLVFRGTLPDYDGAVVVKVFHGLTPDARQELCGDWHEECIAKAAKYEGVLGPRLTFQEGHNVWCLMDAADGSLADAISILSEVRESEIRAVMYHVCRTLADIHEDDHSSHGNLKPSNILLSRSGWVLLTDFAFPNQTGGGFSKRPPHPALLAPERLEPDGAPEDDSLLDVWSLGITIIEAAERIPPFHGEGTAAVLQQLRDAGPPRLMRGRWSEAMQEFVRICLQFKPYGRAEVESLLEHEWFDDVTEENAMREVNGLVERMLTTLRQWSDQNAGHTVSRAQVSAIFHEQWKSSVSSSAASTTSVPAGVDPRALSQLSGLKLPPHMQASSRPTLSPKKGVMQHGRRGAGGDMSPQHSPAMSPKKLRRSMLLGGEEKGPTEKHSGLKGGQHWLSKPDPEETEKPRDVCVAKVQDAEVFVLGPNLNVFVEQVTGGVLVVGPTFDTVVLTDVSGETEDKPVRVAVAAQKVVLRRCQNMELFLHTPIPVETPQCPDPASIHIYPWNLSYPGQAAMFKRAGLDPRQNQWHCLTAEAADPAGPPSLLHDPYAFLCPKVWQLTPPDVAAEKEPYTLLQPFDVPVDPQYPSVLVVQRKRQIRVLKGPGSIGGKDVRVSEVNGSELFLLDSCGNVGLEGLEASTIVIGPSGEVTVAALQNCVLVVAAETFEAEQCDGCFFFLWTKTTPVFRDCCAVSVAEFNVGWDGLPELVSAKGWSQVPNATLQRHGGSVELSVDAQEEDEEMQEEMQVVNYRSRTGGDGPQYIHLRIQGSSGDGDAIADHPFSDFPASGMVSTTSRELPAPLLQSLIAEVPTNMPGPVPSGPVFEVRGRKGETLAYGPSESGPVKKVIFDDLEDTQLLLLSGADEVVLSGLKNTVVALGPVKNLIAKDLQGGAVIAVCEDVSLEQCCDTKFSLWTAHEPVLAACGGLSFFPYCLEYPGLSAQVTSVLGAGAADKGSRHAAQVDLSVLDATYGAQSRVYPAEAVRLLTVGQGSDYPFTPLPSRAAPVPAPSSAPPSPPKVSEPPATTEVPAAAEPAKEEAKKEPEPEGAKKEPEPEGAIEDLWTRACAQALAGEDFVGPWEVEGEKVSGLPIMKRWDKPKVTPFEVSWWRGKTVVAPEPIKRREQPLELTGLFDCRVIALGWCDNVVITNCKNCEFVLGPTSGPLCIRDSERLCVTAACRQLRVRDLSDAELFVHVETDPCIEEGTRIVLRPFNVRMPGLLEDFKAAKLHGPENRFRHAADFSQFADASKEQGFSLPEWVGVVKMRSVAPEGVEGAPEEVDGTQGILDGTVAGGESLEKA